MSRYLAPILVFFLAACGMVTKAPQGGAVKVSEDLVNSTESSPEVFVLNGIKYNITVNHKDMEESEVCPQALLKNVSEVLLDTLSLCEIKIPNYREFDARKDFAFIDFSNYRFHSQVLTYDLDLSLLRGGAIIVECSVKILGNKLVPQGCKGS